MNYPDPNDILLNIRAKQLSKRVATMTPLHRRCVLRKYYPREGPFLYKYRALNSDDVESVSRVKDILVESKLWLSSASAFNDPFDMSIRMTFDGSPLEKRNRMARLVKRQEPLLGFKKRNELVTKLMINESITSAELLQHAQDVGSRRFGVYCFAGDPRSILMWSHYSLGHTGICIQFERSLDVDLAFGAMPVEYSDDFPSVNWVLDAATDNAKGLLRKYSGWSYEKECRLIRHEAANTTIHIDPNAVTAVILGCCISRSARTIIHDIVSEREVRGLPKCEIWEAKKKSGRYALQIARANSVG